MAVLKVIEIMADSPNSWQEAAENAVAQAGKTVNNIKSVWIKDQDALVENGKISQYRVITKITFEVKE